MSSLTKSLENHTSDIIDEAVKCVKEVYFEYLNEDSYNVKLFDILEKL